MMPVSYDELGEAYPIYLDFLWGHESAATQLDLTLPWGDDSQREAEDAAFPIESDLRSPLRCTVRQSPANSFAEQEAP